MDVLLQRIYEKKQLFDALFPLPLELVKNLDEWFRIELTYTSNAIEGNTLSRAETALVVEKGITVEGKTLDEHLEAVNHAQALDFIKSLEEKTPKEITEGEILDIHRIILSKIDDTNAGRYRRVPVRIAGSTVILPNALKVPDLMQDFIAWLNSQTSADPLRLAAEAHYKLVTIHPFVDGNGRTARLLMNLLLAQAGYPMAIIKNEDRKHYIDSIEKAQLGGSLDDFFVVIYEAVERSLDIYLEAGKDYYEDFSGSSNKPLAEKIARAVGTELSPIEIFVFPDGEKRIQIQERVVDEHCVVVQSTATPAAENYMELFFIIDGLKRSGASQVTVVMPYVGYQRQDHIFRDGEAVSLDVVITMLESLGTNKIIAFDMHSIKIPELFHIPVVHLSALPLFADVIIGKNPPRPSLVREGVNGSPLIRGVRGVLVSPDMGGLRRIQQMSELLGGMAWVATVKDRDLDTGKIVINTIEGDVSKITKKAFIIDDMIASGKTIVEAAKLLHKHGASEIYVFATHPVLSKEAPELLQNSLVKKIFITDTVFVPEEKRFPKLEILSVAEMVAKELKHSYNQHN